MSEVRAELRAHTQARNALREIQLEQAREMHEMRVETREGFAKQATGMAHITALLTKIAGPAGLDEGCCGRKPDPQPGRHHRR